ncbi:MAG: DedA family protein, partial [Proteobacteria bacterium]|nr:DedA family protein [Pseudomonadota bacterium]NDD05374.1 DedA family protein [Pseudomonadota bacterium]
MERLFEFLTDLSGGVAYLLIFGILVACGLGFPLPEDIPLIATGYLIWDKTLTWFGGLSVTLLGVLIGDSILFFIGQSLGLKILNKKTSTIFSPKRVKRARAYFRKYGSKVVFFARFVAGLRAVVF